MKKVAGIFLLSIFLVSFVLAVQGNGNNVSSSIGIQFSNQNNVQAGNYENEEGKQFSIQEKEQNRLRIHSGNFSADCNCNLTQEQVQNKTKLKMQLSNGRNAEIKIMPDTASETALTRLRLKVCNESNNCSIELKEVGQGNETKVAYEFQAQKKVKVLGLFRTKAKVTAQVNAENGAFISTKEPWWMSLASEDEE